MQWRSKTRIRWSQASITSCSDCRVGSTLNETLHILQTSQTPVNNRFKQTFKWCHSFHPETQFCISKFSNLRGLEAHRFFFFVDKMATMDYDSKNIRTWLSKQVNTLSLYTCKKMLVSKALTVFPRDFSLAMFLFVKELKDN